MKRSCIICNDQAIAVIVVRQRAEPENFFKMARKKAAKSGVSRPARERLRLDLPNYLPYRITTLAALVRRAFADIYRDEPGLNEPEWKVMTTLAHFGPLPSGDVGHYVTLDRVAVSRALNRLTTLGLVTRRKFPGDQRMFTVDLTPAAARIYDRMAAQALAIEEPILDVLGHREIQELLRLLDKVESCFRSPADRQRMILMRAAQDAIPSPSPRRSQNRRRSGNAVRT
jgi:DNA-binding MarR family transcriptional regulator